MDHDTEYARPDATTPRLSTTFLIPRPSPQIPTPPTTRTVVQQDYFSAKHSQVSADDCYYDHSLAPPPKKFPLHLPRKPTTKRSRPSLPDIRHLGPPTATFDHPPKLPDVITADIDLAACLGRAPPTPPPKDTPQSLRKTRRVKTAPGDSPSGGERTAPRNRSSWPDYFATSCQAGANRNSIPSSKREWWHFRDSPSPPKACSPATPAALALFGEQPSYEMYTTFTWAELQERYSKSRWELYTHPLRPATVDVGAHEKWEILRDLVLFRMMQWRFDWASGKRDGVLEAVGKSGTEGGTEDDEAATKDVKRVEERVKTAKGWGWARA